MEKLKLRGNADAWEFTGTAENALELSGIQLPTGDVTVQPADETNGVEARCYVPVRWGTHILEPGDWILLMDTGVVLTLTRRMKTLLTEPQSTQEQVRVLEGKVANLEEEIDQSRVVLMSFESYTDEAGKFLIDNSAAHHQLDWQVASFTENETLWHVLSTVATGRELGRWQEGDAVRIFDDGTVEVRVGGSVWLR